MLKKREFVLLSVLLVCALTFPLLWDRTKPASPGSSSSIATNPSSASSSVDVEWERVNIDTERMRVHKGWLVRTRYSEHSATDSMVFVEYINGLWVLK